MKTGWHDIEVFGLNDTKRSVKISHIHDGLYVLLLQHCYLIREWNGLTLVAGVDCGAVPLQKNGRPVNCVAPFTVDYECNYECDTGYTLPNLGTDRVICELVTSGSQTSSRWDTTPTDCEGQWRFTFVFSIYQCN